MNVKKKDPEIKEIQAPASSVLPLFSNLTLVNPHKDMVLIDFAEDTKIFIPHFQNM